MREKDRGREKRPLGICIEYLYLLVCYAPFTTTALFIVLHYMYACVNSRYRRVWCCCCCCCCTRYLVPLCLFMDFNYIKYGVGESQGASCIMVPCYTYVYICATVTLSGIYSWKRSQGIYMREKYREDVYVFVSRVDPGSGSRYPFHYLGSCWKR